MATEDISKDTMLKFYTPLGLGMRKPYKNYDKEILASKKKFFRQTIKFRIYVQYSSQSEQYFRMLFDGINKQGVTTGRLPKIL